MIIEAVQNMKNRILVSYFDSGCSKLNTDFSLFATNEKIAWNITNSEQDGTDAYIIVEFVDTVILNNVKFSTTSPSTPFITVSYSNDYKVYEEHEYISYTLLSTDGMSQELIDVVKSYEQNIIRIIPQNRTYIVLEKDSIKPADISDNSYMLLKTLIEEQIGVEDKLDIRYVYTYLDKYTNTETYLINKPIKSVKLNLASMTTPFSLDFLKCFVEESIDINKSDMNYIKSFLFQPKYFEEYEFIPSMVSSYFDMLVEKG